VDDLIDGLVLDKGAGRVVGNNDRLPVFVVLHIVETCARPPHVDQAMRGRLFQDGGDLPRLQLLIHVDA